MFSSASPALHSLLHEPLLTGDYRALYHVHSSTYREQRWVQRHNQENIIIPHSDVNLAILLLDLATFQTTPAASYFSQKSTYQQIERFFLSFFFLHLFGDFSKFFKSC